MMKVAQFLLIAPLCVGAFADTIEIRPAVVLRFPTVENKSYQIDVSNDLGEWKPFQDPIFGRTGTVERFDSAENGRSFYQLVVRDVVNLNAQLETIRTANNVPALACAVIRSNQIVALGAVGLRKAGVPSAPVTLQDIWHHGSLTKSMTATLAAILVEQGAITWSTTLAEVFPDFAPQMNAAWRTVSLDWLCSNRSGAPEDLAAIGLWNQLQAFQGTPREARRFLLERLTVLAPKSTPGTQYEYSNAGFALAGHMLETVANQAWEDLLTERLFVPIGMSSAGFGVPATPRYINQPWGHQIVGGRPSPIEPGPSADNPPAIGPAATVHCSLIDLAKFAAFHVAGHKADTALLKRDSVLKLHTAPPNNSNYAYGWLSLDRPWAGGSALQHAGSNTQWYSVIWLAPNVDFAVVALCNLATSSGANPGVTATDQAVSKMIQQFLTN